MRKVLYWILFPACAISIGAIWPIRDAIADFVCNASTCTVSRADLQTAKNLIIELQEANKALAEEAAFERNRKHPVCHDA